MVFILVACPVYFFGVRFRNFKVESFAGKRDLPLVCRQISSALPCVLCVKKRFFTAFTAEDAEVHRGKQL